MRGTLFLVSLANVYPLRSPGLDPGPTGFQQPEEPQDAELVRRAIAGDVHAKETLCRRHLRNVRALLYRMLPADPELDDLVQETFVLALDKLENVREGSSIKWWLRGIAINVARHRLRRRRFLAHVGASLYTPEAAAPLLSRDAPPDVVTELRNIYAVLDRLRPDSRLALVLTRLEGMTLAEVAQHLEISVATVSRRLATAELELKAELERRGES